MAVAASAGVATRSIGPRAARIQQVPAAAGRGRVVTFDALSFDFTDPS